MFLIDILLFSGAVYAGKKIYNKYIVIDKTDTEKPDSTLPNTLSYFYKEDSNRQLQTLPSSEIIDQIESMDEETNHYFLVSSAGLGIAVAGVLFSPLLALLSLPITGYTSWPVFKTAYRSIFKERRLSISILDSTAIIVGIGSGYYMLSAFSNFIYFFAARLLNKTKNKTRNSLINIFQEQPTSVWLLKDNVEVSVPIESIQSGDCVVVDTGEIIPVDGIITQGIASIDQHILTGEAQAEEKTVNEKVFATTVVLTGRICICVEKTGKETIAAQIGEILNNTASFEEALQTRGEQIADKTVAPTLGVGALTLVTQGPYIALMALSSNFSEVIRLTTPLNMLNYLHIASQNGILIKDGRSLELLRQVDTIVFDKTGTLTLAQPHVTNIYSCHGLSEVELLAYAAAAEYKQNHPIARAILFAAEKRKISLLRIENAEYTIGHGIQVCSGGKTIRVGSARFILNENIAIPKLIQKLQNKSHEQGNSLVYVAVDNRLGGVLELQPSIRPEAKSIVQALRKNGLTSYIISGDHEQPTQRIAQELEIEHYFAETLPEEKANLIEQLQQEGRSVCFVGDGINDSIALKKATVSISLRGASTVATDTAQIVLMDTTLKQLAYVFELAGKFHNNQKVGIACSTIPGIICTGGVFFSYLGLPSVLAFYNISAITGVGSAMLPLLQESRTSEKRN
ncbi:MAG: heavy metal translocating P-type ATPase [SAR324 cluster bacterium]|nr:heavy metal translocating P-type ATPase [SAR324 cluster bacterium]